MTVKTLYTDMVGSGVEIDHHESDLYVPDTPKVREILSIHGKSVDGHNVQRFTSQIDGKPWLDIPFAYTPFWDAAPK